MQSIGWLRGAQLLAIALAVTAVAADSNQHYSVVIDAGSTGTRVHVWTWHRNAGQAVIKLPSLIEKVNPGLSFYAPTGVGAGQSLQPLLKFAQQQVPRSKHATTSLHVFATAGLRMLPAAQAQAIVSSVSQVCSQSGFLFKPAWVRILPGENEGIYAWVAINYAAGVIQGWQNTHHGAALNSSSTIQALAPATTDSSRGPKQAHKAFLPPGSGTTWDVIEMGGASVQITSAADASFNSELLGASRYLEHSNYTGMGGDQQLYTQSFLGQGADVAFRSMLKLVKGNASNPCLPTGCSLPGSPAGSGDFDSCANLAMQLLHSNCTQVGDEACRLGNGKLPRFPGSHAFLATEVLYFTARQLGLPHGMPDMKTDGAAVGMKSIQGRNKKGVKRGQHIHRYQLQARGMDANQDQWSGRLCSVAEVAAAGRTFCAQQWSHLHQLLVQKQGHAEEHIRKTCFNAAWIWVVLRAGLGFEQDDKQLLFSNLVQAVPDGRAVEVNWVLGALLAEVLGPAGDLDITQSVDETVQLTASSLDLLRGSQLVMKALLWALLFAVFAYAAFYWPSFPSFTRWFRSDRNSEDGSSPPLRKMLSKPPLYMPVTAASRTLGTNLGNMV